MSRVPPTPGARAWAEAARACALLAADPGLGGAVLTGSAGPARDAWLDLLKSLMPPAAPWRRLPPGVDDDRLIGGVDLGAALMGRREIQPGLLAEAHGGVLIAQQAERMAPGTVARLCAALDRGETRMVRDGIEATLPSAFRLVALDERLPGEAACADPMVDRLALRLDLSGIGWRDVTGASPRPGPVIRARGRVAKVRCDGAAIDAVCAAAEALGVGSLRAPLFALRLARAHAALKRRDEVTEDDLALAIRLVLVPRATRRPETEAEVEPDAPPPDPTQDAEGGEDEDRDAMGDRLVQAAAAALPPGMEALWAEAARLKAKTASGGAGRQAAPRRGRRIGVKSASPREGVLDVPATLKAAAPWQRLRGRTDRLLLRRDDFRIRRFQQKTETTVILVVDASGSTALQRLAETKGAVELLLAEAYVRRTQVALIAFRGAAAEVLVPPTRSLTRARRLLADLAGGGATPLASALETGLTLALAERARQRRPLLVIMTDGRGNVALDGEAFRTRAETETRTAAQRLRAAGVASALIDVSPRPRGDGERLAETMGATFSALPYVHAGAVQAVVRSLEPA
ncbi:magnesium chelatase subunit D [Brevundimonas sp.]|jgi:magnesium chelatase subunit D|uniref:magnesium chelatase subunit D n=1 Tax=Brevundimonas sp. TaxID=1871086 RepID=UPI002E0F7DF4|nr:magnesium chelatase subunit D [Brevundimonas sp.]